MASMIVYRVHGVYGLRRYGDKVCVKAVLPLFAFLYVEPPTFLRDDSL